MFGSGLASGVIADSDRSGGEGSSAENMGVIGLGPLAAACLIGSGGGCALTVAATGSGAVAGNGTSTAYKSGTSIRRSCQGKLRPGSPSPCPTGIRLSSNAWISNESRNASVSRLRSAFMGCCESEELEE